MSEHDDKARLERRGFLRGLGLAAGGAATAVAVPAVAAEDEAGRAETDEEQAKKRYQENDHVRRFYALNRL